MDSKNTPILVLCTFNAAVFIISLSLDIEAIAYTGLQGIWISRWIYLAAGALGLLVTFFEQDKRIYYLSLATAVLAASFGIAAAALYGQLAGRYSIISLDSNSDWVMLALSLLAAIANAALAFLLHKANNSTATQQEPNPS